MILKTKFIFILFSSLAFSSAEAQIPKAKTLLWKIGGKGLSDPSYIFGTFHLLCKDDLKFPDTLQSIIYQSQQVYFEIKLDDPDIAKKMMQSIKMNEGHQLKDFLSMQEYDSVSIIFQNKTQIPLQFVSNYKHYLLMSILYPSILGCTPIAYEKEIEKRSSIDSIPILGLEPLELQLSIFDSIPYKEQAKMLVKSLLHYEDSKKESVSMISMYQKKDIEAMHKTVESDKEFGKYESLLLNRRNASWIPIIIKAIQNKKTLFAVGAGHLGGTNGILNLLKQKGFIVTPVFY